VHYSPITSSSSWHPLITSTVTVLGRMLCVTGFGSLSARRELPCHRMPVIDARLLVTPQYTGDFRGNSLERRGWNAE
jgi:hypothetical protein